jgi:hypothetical protein
VKREVIYYKIYQWENRIKQNKVKNVNKKNKAKDIDDLILTYIFNQGKGNIKQKCRKSNN